MFCVSAFRASSLSAIKLFLLFKLFHATIGENSVNLQPDQFFNQEVSDFQTFLEEKLSNKGPRTDFLNLEVAEFQKFLEEKPLNQGSHANQQLKHDGSLHSFSNDDWDVSSDESEEVSYEDNEEPVVSRSNEESQQSSAENVAELDPLHKREDSPVQSDPLYQNDGGVHEIQDKEQRREETHRRPLEILLIRETDPKAEDPMAGILEEVLSPKKPIHKSIEPKEPYVSDTLPDILEDVLSPKKPNAQSAIQEEPYPDSRMSLPMSVNKESSTLPPDICSASNHSFYDRQTCSSGYQYKLEPHLSATFSEDLKAEMLERYLPPKQTVCGFQRRMNPHKDVTERALCPFHWKVSERNPSRIPEYMYEAKCSCTDSCAELKSKIRVLWRVGCEENLHVYKEGWEEIAVACVPTKPPIIKSEKAHRLKVTAPHK